MCDFAGARPWQAVKMCLTFELADSETPRFFSSTENFCAKSYFTSPERMSPSMPGYPPMMGPKVLAHKTTKKEWCLVF